MSIITFTPKVVDRRWTWGEITIFLHLAFFAARATSHGTTIIINYNVYQAQAYSINYYGPPPEKATHLGSSQNMEREATTLLPSDPVTGLKQQEAPRATRTNDINLEARRDDEEACQICQRYMESHLVGGSRRDTQDIRTRGQPKLGGQGIRLKRQDPNWEDKLLGLLSRYQVSTQIECEGITFLLEPTIRARRDKRDLHATILGQLKTHNNDRRIGMCSTQPKNPITTRKCQHVIGWDLKQTGTCGFLLSCDPGYSFSDGSCLLNDLDPENLSICSDLEYYISKTPVPIAPALPIFMDMSLCFNKSIASKTTCSEGKQVRRMISLIGVNNGEFLVTKPHSFIFHPDYSSILNYQCKKCRNEMECNNCEGDEVYMENIPTARLGVACSCQVLDNPRIGGVSLVLDDSAIQIDYRMSSVEWVTLKSSEILESEILKKGCTGCSAQCDGGSVQLMDFPEGCTQIKLCMFALCTVTDYAPNVDIPLSYRLIPTTLRISVFKSDIMIYKTTLMCQRQDSCQMIKCHICWRRLLNPGCYEVLDGLTAIVSGLTGLLLLSIMVKALKLVWLLCLILKLISQSIYRVVKVTFILSLKLCGKSVSATRKVYRRIETFADGESLEVVKEYPLEVRVESQARMAMSHQEWKLLNDTNRTTVKTASSPGKPPYILISLILLSWVGTTSCCTTVTHLNFTATDCRPINGSIVCETDQYYDLIVGTTGADACLLVQNGDGIMGSVHLSINSIKTRCSEELLYWTYETEPLVQTNCHCWGELHCRDLTCHENNITNVVATQEGLDLNQGPGLIACTKVRSEFLGKCILPLDGCCFYSITFPPSSPPLYYKVSQCSSFFWEIGVEVKSYLSKTPDIQNVRLMVGVEKQVGSIKMLASHISSPPTPLQGNCILYSPVTNESYYAECNRPSEQVIGKIGEIQCGSESDSKTGSKTCSWIKSMIRIQTDFTQIKPQVSVLKLSRALIGMRLPLATPVMTFKHDYFGYYTTRSMSESFNLRLKLPPMSTLQFSELATCSLRSLGLIGCYKCLQGAQLKLHASCEMYPALARISCPSSLSSLPLVISKSGNVTLRLMLNGPWIDETCEYVAGKTKATFHIKGVLLVLPRVTDGLSTSFVSVDNNMTTGSVEVFKENFKIMASVITNFFSSLLPWWLGVLIISVISFLIVKIVISVGWAPSRSKLDWKKV